MKITIKNVISTLLLQVITVLCGFIVPKLIISTYGSDVNGLVVSITQFLGYITLLEAGFGPLIKSILYKPVSKNNKEEIEEILKTSENIFRKIAYIFLIYILFLCVLFPFIISNNFDKLFTISLVLIISISIFSEYFFGMTYKLYLQVRGKIYVISIIQTSILLINTIVTVILVKLNTNIQIVKLVSVFILVMRPIAQNLYVKKKYNISLKNNSGNYVIKQKWDAFMQHIAYVIHTNIDMILITIFMNVKEVSVYSIYLLILNSISNFSISFLGGTDAIFGDMVAKNDYNRLNSRFKTFINIYFSIISIIFSATLFLILPFIKLYTKGITDANYIRPLFSYIIVIATFIYLLKRPFYDLVKAAGHFKETKMGAVIEALLNLIISVALIFKFGLVGAAIGTLISTFIRTIEIMYYTMVHILKDKFNYIIKRLVLIIIDFIIISILVFLINYNVNNYIDWIIYALLVTIISALIIIISNIFINNNLLKEIKKMRKTSN